MYLNKETNEMVSKVVVRGTSLPRNPSEDLLQTLGFATVIATTYPAQIKGRIISEGSAVLIEGLYYQTWDIDDSNVDPMRELRITRDNKLVSSDYTQATDNTSVITDQELWATYRQELRDLPATYASNPEDVIWPIAPSSSDTLASDADITS
jgi:hypothetical protein